MIHGLYSTYLNHKCKCVECRAAIAKRQRDLYQAGLTKRSRQHKRRPVGEPLHGTESRYSNTWKCRCDACRKAHSDRVRREREDKKNGIVRTRTRKQRARGNVIEIRKPGPAAESESSEFNAVTRSILRSLGRGG